jgi:predicted AlkP superfamily pyrophosphatase or phosphodiesterase
MAAALLLLLTAFQPTVSHGQAFAAPDPAAIKLVLLVAVDQFRYDYLTRYRAEFAGGVGTLLKRGAVFTDAHLEHGTTVTAVGHATMLSGALPTVSGIISNGWYDRTSRGPVTSVNDPSVQLLGATGEASSPHRLLVSTVADELKMAARPDAASRPRAIGISMKDRSAILPVGRMADAAYWFDNIAGTFVSSTYYMPAVPTWVSDFNARRMPDAYAGKRWTFGATDGGRDFPAEVGLRLNEALYTSPIGNEMLLAFAKEALVREQLGQRGVTDVFSVSFSSNDAVGHRYGPDSPEVADMIRTTDVAIASLFAEVDRVVGLAHTLVVFTTDHGVAPLPETASGWRMPGGRFAGATVNDAMQQALEARFGKGAWLLASGSSVYLDHALIASKRLDPAVVRRVAADAAAAVPNVARVFTREELLGGAVPGDRISQRVARSYHATRSGDLEIVLEPYWIRGATGSTHGSPYNYDSHIPLVLMGPGVQPGTYHQHAALNDVAPTLSALLGIETPSGSSGRVLVEVLTRQQAMPLQAPTH